MFRAIRSWRTRHYPAMLAIVLSAAIGSAATARTPALSPPGDEGGVALDGKTAFSVPSDALALNREAITVAAWVRVRKDGPSQVFLNSGNAGSVFTFYLYHHNVRMLIGREEGRYLHAQAPPPEPGTWTHYAGSYDGQVIRVYMNGELVNSTRAPGRMQSPPEDVFIGALNPEERFLDGGLEDVRIWRRVLDAEEIAALAAGRADDRIDRDLAAAWHSRGLTDDGWRARVPDGLTAGRIKREALAVIINGKDDGYRGIWYMNQRTGDEYVYKYSGGLGTYCANHIPHAWYAEEVDKTFFTYGGTTKDSYRRLIHMVSYYDHKTGMVPRPTILLDKRTSDAHDNPVINLDDEGYIWIFSSSHGTGRPSFISRSTEPYAIDEFELVWTGNFSYPQPWHIPGKGFLFLHTHYTGGRANCMMTSPDGVEWTERVFLSRIARGHYQISNPWRGRKVGTAFNYHPQETGLNYRTNLYYMETHDFGDTWTNVQGEKLDLMLTEVENPALVVEYESKGLKVYTQDITFDEHGRPIIMYVTTPGYEPGPANSPRVWTIARWTGSEWEIHGGDIVSDNAYDFGSLYIEAPDLWRIIGPTEVGPQPYNPGGEMAMWTSRDQGRSWRKVREMTSGSPYNHTFARRPVNAHPDFYAFWADGHGRQPSDSRLYFCNRDGDVFRLPVTMDTDHVTPRRLEDEMLRLYIGTYTSGESKGIYTLMMDPVTGELGPARLAAESVNPSFLALHPNREVLYAVNEIGDFQGGRTGAVSAFAFSRGSGELTLLNQQPSGGQVPCHLAVDRGGRNVVVANYTSGTAAVLPIGEDGRLGEARSVVQHEGSGAHPQRQRGPHAHAVTFDPDERFVFVADLGVDRVFAYRYDAESGSLLTNEPEAARLAPGAGPRHFTFHPSGRFAYVINELNSTVTAFAYDAGRGALRELQTVSTLPERFNEDNTTAEVRVHPSGRFLYGSNRGHDSIAAFAIDRESGRLTAIGHTPSGGSTPRNFNIDPNGRWLVAANQRSDNLVVLAIDQETGALTPTGITAEIPAPVCVTFLAEQQDR